MEKAIVVFGPHGCGKTKNAEALRRKYGMTRVVDDLTLDDPSQLKLDVAAHPSTLYLTSDKRALEAFRAESRRFLLVPYRLAMAGLPPEPESKAG